MTLEQLRVFVAVAEALNMTRAAEALHLSQPAVSAAISALEGRHAVALFDRVGRSIELTEAGRQFLPEARAVLKRADEARRVLTDLTGLVRGEIRIAASQTVATYWLPQRLARFATAHPGIALSLTVGNTAQTAQAVLAGDADIGLVEGEVRELAIAARRVGGDHLGLYAAPEHPLAGTTIQRRHLEQAIWVVRERGSGTRDHFEAGLRTFGLTIADIDVRLELPSNGAVLEAIETGDMIAAVSDLAAFPRLKAGLVARLDCAIAKRDFHLLTHHARRMSRATEAFVQSLDIE